MAVEFDVPMTRTSEYLCLPEDVQIDPAMNGRHELPDIEALVDSILTHGQLQPVTIRRTAGKPVLVAGFSRWRAISHINKKGLAPKPIKLRCSYTQLTEQQAFLANIEENRVRNATTPIDDAYNIQRLINVYQMSEDEAADAYRASVSWVKGRLKLLELTPEAEKAVRSGRVAPSAAKAIAKLSKEHQKAVVAKQGKITAADVRREAPAPAKVPAKPATAIGKALKVLFAECDQQPDVMVYEIHKDTVRALRDAAEGK
jgi:ParB/RepB/Spo0J family partition protein